MITEKDTGLETKDKQERRKSKVELFILHSALRTMHSKGFTLFELLVTLVVAGVLVGVASSNLGGLFARTKLNEAVTNVRGALQEAQREAIRTSKNCAIQLNNKDSTNSANVTNTTVTLNGNTIEGCIFSTRELDSNITLGSNYTNSDISPAPSSPNVGYLVFGYKGNMEDVTPPPPSPGEETFLIINISHQNYTAEEKCIAVSYPLGITRIGIYDPATGDCNKE